ncbi:MAG: PIG-L family deacetylase [Candidatus Latescibacteria bacterium]|nr:PIG-L family deacetylase [Candidatus Latescibacterota bacterium]
MADQPCIVAIGAHTADMEFTAGATLLKHVRQSWDAHVVSLTLGEKGSARLSPAEYGAQKKAEAEQAGRPPASGHPSFLYLPGRRAAQYRRGGPPTGPAPAPAPAPGDHHPLARQHPPGPHQHLPPGARRQL